MKVKSQIGKEIKANLSTFIATANGTRVTSKLLVFSYSVGLDEYSYQVHRLLIEFLLRISANH